MRRYNGIRRSRLPIVLVGMLVGLALAGCSNETTADVYHVEVGSTQTQAAIALAANSTTPTPTRTPGPSPTPTLPATPYEMPADPPDYDGSTVITRVGNEAITLEAFRQRVRFERWYPLRLLAERVERRGTGLLDLTNPENSNTASLFATLADSNSFGIQVQRVMVIESIARQEAARREIEVDPYQFNAKLAGYLGLQVGENGSLPPEFDAAYEDFLAELESYTGMTEEDFRRIVRAQTAYSQLEFLIGQEPDVIPQDQASQAGMEVRDVVLGTEERAAEVAQRLRDGEALNAIMESLGQADVPEENVSRIIARSNQELPADVLDAIFSAEPGSVVGPLVTSQGWYVARVVGEKLQVLSPSDIDALRDQYFLDWVEARMDDPAYTIDQENWYDLIPQEPLPQDVSPLLHDENVVLPDDPFAGTEEPDAAATEPADAG